jgi:hypothetical protein
MPRPTDWPKLKGRSFLCGTWKVLPPSTSWLGLCYDGPRGQFYEPYPIDNICDIFCKGN